MIFSTLCTGGAGADYGARLAGMDHGFGVEYDPAIADVAWLNGFATIIADIRDVAYSDLTRPDWLHASPPCINASVANTKAGETDLDMELAQAVCRAIVALKPDYFSLENVRGYAHFKAYQAIKECLLANDYKYIDGILNAADYGTPQARIRLFLVASRVSTPRLPLPTHYDARSGAMNMLLKPWIGWHAAISDLLDDLPETEFAPWQLKRLPEHIKESALISRQGDNLVNDVDRPSPTLTSEKTGSIRAVLVGNSGYDGGLQIQDAEQPMNTVTSNPNQTNLKAYLINSENAGQQYSDGLRRESQPSMTISTASKPKAYLVAGGNKQTEPYSGDRPSYTVAINSGSDRAFVIDGQTGSYGTAMTIRSQDEPMYTIAATADRRPARAYIGRVVKLSPRCLARFNGLSDDYKLPDKQSLACKVLGNMVMPLVMKAIIESNIAR